MFLSFLSQRKPSTWASLALVLLAGSGWAQADSEALPVELVGVGIEEHLNAPLPLDLMFQDVAGQDAPLAEHFAGDLPVILTLNYSKCPNLCDLQLQGMVSTLKSISETAGQDFQLVTVSVDPDETEVSLGSWQNRLLDLYDRQDATWTFLRGDNEAIAKLADAVGFRYQILEETGEFAHTACSFLLTPGGTVARYLYGVQPDADTLRFSLLEADAGRSMSTLDKVLLFCFRYDPERGKYTLAAMNLLRVAGIFTVLALAGVIVRRVRRDRAQSSA